MCSNRSFIQTVTWLALACGVAQTALAREGDIVIRGRISALSPALITVGDVSYVITPDTEFEDELESPLGFSDFHVGDLVDVKGPRIGGVLTAREIELEDEENDDEPGGGPGRGRQLRVRCKFPSLSHLSRSLGTLITNQLEEDGFQSVSVRVRLRRLALAPAVTIDAENLLAGVTVFEQNSGAALDMSLSGIVDGLRQCEGEFEATVRTRAQDSVSGLRIFGTGTSTVKVMGFIG